MNSHCVAICQLSTQPQEDFDVNTELLILDGGDVHVSHLGRGTARRGFRRAHPQ